VLSQFKKYHPSGNLELNNAGIFQSLKLRILMEKIISISLKLKFTPNTLGCYGLVYGDIHNSSKLKKNSKQNLKVNFKPQGLILSFKIRNNGFKNRNN